MFKIQDNFIPKFKIGDCYTTSAGVSIPTIIGQVGQVDVVSQNGYYYRTDFWDKILGDNITQEQIANHDMLGTIEHPEEDDAFLRTPYSDASHIILKAWVQDHNPFAMFGLLNNEKGNQIKALVDVGHRPGVSTRGMGQFGSDDKGQYVDDQDYVLITWDVVRSPNFSKLHMDPVTDSLSKNPLFKELCEVHKIKDSSYNGYNHSKLQDDRHKLVSEIRERLSKLETLC